MRHFIVLTFLIALTHFTYSQGVSINNDGSAPAAGSMLDIQSTSGGLLIPRMTEAQRDAITPDTHSMLIYQTNNDSGFYYYDETTTSWLPFLTGGKGANAGWRLQGNTGTNPNTHFIGTTDAQDWVIKTNNNEQLRIDQNGNVGIGTNNPVRKIQIARNNNTAVSPVVTNANELIRVGGDGLVDTWGSFSTDNIAMILGATNSLNAGWIGTQNSYNFHIRTKNDARIIIDTVGNVGIGTTNPVDLLQTESGNIRIKSANNSNNTLHNGIIFTTDVDSRSAKILAERGGASTETGLRFQTYNGAQIDAMTLLDDGNVGISTNTPVEKLEVIGTGKFNGLLLTTVTPTYQAGVLGFTDANWGFLHRPPRVGTRGAHHFEAFDGTDLVTIEDNGNVGIGTTSPQAHLEVEGPSNNEGTVRIDDYEIKLLNTFQSHWSIFNENSTGKFLVNNTSVNQATGTSGVNAITIAPNATNTVNNVGIGTTTPGYLLQVGQAGDGTQARANAWNILSDRRLKKNFEDIDDPLSKVLKLKGVYFDWKSTDKKDLGFIAQDVQTIIPEIVSKSTTDGYFSMQYGNITALLVEAMKEQQQIIKDLQKDNKNLKAKNNYLEQKDQELESRVKKLEEYLKASSEK